VIVRRRTWLLTVLGAWTLLALPPLRLAMEATMVTHALQIALLAGIGGLLGRSSGLAQSDHPGGCNRYGITGTVLALLTLFLWLLPVSLDRALDEKSWEIAKFLSVPLLLGLPLARSWSRLPAVARGALWANAIPMALVMGWLYREAPLRLCNNYLVGDQQVFGLALWSVAGAIGAWWAFRALFGFGQIADSK